MMLIYKSKIYIPVIVYVVLTIITTSLLKYLGYDEMRPYFIVITSPLFCLFLLKQRNPTIFMLIVSKSQLIVQFYSGSQR